MKYSETLVTLKEFYRLFGEYREERVHNNLTYRGWAPKGTDEATAGWIIEREAVSGELTHISQAPFSGGGNVTTQIWDDRASLFSSSPWGVSFCTSFDGVNDFVNIGDNLNLERTDAFSFSFWVYLDNVTSAMTFFSKRSGSGVTPGLQLNMLSNGRLEANLVNTASTNLIRKQMTVSVLPQTRYNVTWTYDGSSSATGLILYLNGISQTLSTVNNTLSASMLTSTEGTFGQFASSQYLSGKMWEITRFDKALSSSEVLEIYNGGVNSDPSDYTFAANMANYWKAGTDDVYPTWDDNTGGLDGTMTNMTESSFTRDVP